MKITIVGAGRLGKTIFTLLSKNGRVPSLVKKNMPIPTADLYVLTVPDSKISEVSQKISTDGVVLHTSGSLGLEVLKKHKNKGIIHPLMTFPGPDIAIPPPPIPASL